MKKPPSKVAHNRPRTFFFCTGPAAQTAKKQKSHTTKSPLMQDWVFRLGALPFARIGFVGLSNLDGAPQTVILLVRIVEESVSFGCFLSKVNESIGEGTPANLVHQGQTRLHPCNCYKNLIEIPGLYKLQADIYEKEL